MEQERLLDVIADADLELRICEHDTSLDGESRRDVVIARQLLGKLRQGVLRRQQSVLLGDNWPFSTLRLILPAIGALEERGISILYRDDDAPQREVASAP